MLDIWVDEAHEEGLFFEESHGREAGEKYREQKPEVKRQESEDVSKSEGGPEDDASASGAGATSSKGSELGEDWRFAARSCWIVEISGRAVDKGHELCGGGRQDHSHLDSEETRSSSTPLWRCHSLP